MLKYRGKAIAGSLQANDPGLMIVSEKVLNHYAKDSTSCEPEFRELVSCVIVEITPGALRGSSITWLTHY